MSINEKQPKSRPVLTLTIFFLLMAIATMATQNLLLRWNVDPVTVEAGNLLLFIVTLISLLLYQRAMTHTTTMGFLRNTYSSLFFKLLVCAGAIAVYVLVNKERVNKPAIFICVFLYFIYSLLEVRSLMQWNKARRNG